MQALAATAPDDVANLRQLGVAHHKVGNVLGNPNYPNIGNHAGALAEMEQSIAVFARASSRYPENAMFRRNLAVARSNAADILTALGRRDEAMAQERLALETYEAQVREDPTNAAARNDLAIAHYKQAEMLDAAGQHRARRWPRSSGRRRSRTSWPRPIRTTRGPAPRPSPTTPCAASCRPSWASARRRWPT